MAGAQALKKKPLTERRRRLAEGLAAGKTGPQAAEDAGYTGVRAAEGVTAAEAKRDERVQEIIAKGQAEFRRLVEAGRCTILATFFPDEYEPPRGSHGRKRKAPLTLKAAAHLAMRPEILRAAGFQKEQVEHTGPDGGPVQSQVSFYIPENGRSRP